MSNFSEKELINRAKNDPKLFGELYEMHMNQIFNYIYKRVLDFDLANDLTAETFLKAYLGLWRFQWKQIPFIAWLYRIANNEIANYYRKKSYQPTSLQAIYGSVQLEKNAFIRYQQEKEMAELQVKKMHDFNKIQKIISTLPLKYQEVISLKYFEQKKIKEIALILNKREGTVKSLLSRGIKRIQAYFDYQNSHNDEKE